MKFLKRTIEFKILLALIIGILAYNLTSTFLMSLHSFLENTRGLEPRLNSLLIPLICSLGLTMLWKAAKTEYISLVLGQIIILIFVFNRFSFSDKTIMIFQSVGMILFLVAIIRMFVFLLRRQSNKFIENLLLKCRKK